MACPVSVHLVPQYCDPELFPSAVAVVIDVLRASTTIVQALAAGAREVIPCEEVEEALRKAAGYAPDSRLLGGEREGKRISQFDLGNSPAEYTPERVAGRSVIFTTTNGTRALTIVRLARRVYVAGLVNVNAVVRRLVAEACPVFIVCAGTNGSVTAEDMLCAGALVAGLKAAYGPGPLDGAATLSLSLFEAQGRTLPDVLQTLRESQGGRNLIKLGMETDLALAARWDSSTVVPVLTPEGGLIAADTSGDGDRQWVPAPEEGTAGD